MKFCVNSIGELPFAAEKLLRSFNDKRIIAFYGDMGAGKTTFIKAICEVLGVIDTVASPSFSIINEYSSPAGPLFHFDFYRLKDQSEALDLGCEDYFYSGYYCFLEWPERIPGLLPEHCVNVSIELTGPGARTITVTTT